MSSNINRMEIAAYHEAGHCVAACVSGLEILDDGCRIQELDDGVSFAGSAAIKMDGCDQEGEMITAIGGATAAFVRDTELLKQCGELSEEISSAIYDRTAEGMLAIDVTGEGKVSADVEFMVCFLPTLTDTWYRGTDDQKKILALAAAGAVVGRDRTRINSRIKEFSADAPRLNDSWYITVEDAAKAARVVVDDRRETVGALASRLLKEKQISGPDVKKFLDDNGCPCASARPVDSPPEMRPPFINPFRRTP